MRHIQECAIYKNAPYTRIRHIQRKTPLLSTSCGVLSMFNLKISFVTSERLASFTVIR